MAKIQAIRGMNDILPAQTPAWQYLERTIRSVTRRYGYNEIRFPVLEQTQLFKRSIGEVTDIVEKEMYTFDDRNGDSLSLRPEGTACCVRAADQHGLLYNQQQRLWYQGPMFRHERPQKGRYRQFYQLGIEAFGMAGPDIDAEVICLSAGLWKQLGIEDHLTLQINNIGGSEDRKNFGLALKAYLEQYKERLDSDSQRRLESNPLRILDSKSPDTQQILKNAPVLADFTNEQSNQHFHQLKQLLESAGIKFSQNPRLVRGLDYYNNAVFEWTTDSLGAQGTVCAGGRYDGLVAKLGGKPTLAVGFAMALERLILMLESLDLIPPQANAGLDIYVLIVGESVVDQGLRLSEQLRCSCPKLRVLSHCGGGKYNNQLKKAFSSGAKWAVIVEAGQNGEELRQIKLRRLHDDGQTELLSIDKLVNRVKELFPA